MDKNIEFLIKVGRDRLNSSRSKINFETGIPEAENILNNLEEYPHIFVLACVMDRQIKAGRAWSIPYLVGKSIGGWKFENFLNLSASEIKEIFNKNKLHRFNDKMAQCFYSAINDIKHNYNGNAKNIWANNPKSALVIRRFLEFKGVGIKIANMATNILARDFKIKMQEYSSIDVAPDIQVKKYFMQFQKHILKNGARLIVAPMKDTRTFTVLLLFI